MNNTIDNEQEINPVVELDQQVSHLIERYERMEKENQLLRAEQQKLASQNTQLSENNKQVKVKIESLLNRLKGLGNIEDEDK